MGFFNKNKQKEKRTVIRTPGVTYRAARGLYKNFFNVSAWLSFDYMKNSFASMYALLKSIFQKPESTRQESFEQAMLRMNLSEKDIDQRYEQSKRLSWLYATMMSVIWAYSLYLFLVAPLLSGALAFVVGGICALKFVKMRFWMYQIRERRLGCSLRDWLGLHPVEEDK